MMKTFEERTIPEPNSGCLLWTGAMFKRGYGMLKEGKKTIYAHRRAWEMEYGSIPRGMDVLHRCDTPLCVRPEHLFLGTQADNNSDRDRKGRGGWGLGASKLTESQVREIMASGKTQMELAAQFGIRQTQVSNIKTKRCWKDLWQ